MGYEFMRRSVVKLLILLLVATIVPLIVIKGDLVNYVAFMQGKQAYLGSSLVKKRTLIKTPSLYNSIIYSDSYEDNRRRHPRFKLAPESVLNSKTTPEELSSYKEFLLRLNDIKANDNAQLNYKSVVKVTNLVHDAYQKNLSSERPIEVDVLGRSKSHPEDYVYQLVNAKTACGTVGEATVALLRELGFKTRLIILSNKPQPLEANHILAEVYAPDLHQWIMVDPMINYTGKESVFELIRNSEKASLVNQQHAYEDTTYSNTSVVWFDQKSLFRKIYYYTPEKNNFPKVLNEIKEIN